MNKQHNLIVQYLQIMQEQGNMINELSETNAQLVKINSELEQHKRMYKENQDSYDDIRKEIADYVNSNMEHDMKDFKEVDAIRRCRDDERVMNIKAGALKRVMNDIEKERRKLIDMLLERC